MFRLWLTKTLGLECDQWAADCEHWGVSRINTIGLSLSLGRYDLRLYTSLMELTKDDILAGLAFVAFVAELFILF